MTRTPPTMSELKEIGMRFMEAAQKELVEDHSITPTILLGDAADGTKDVVIVIHGELMNSFEAKDQISENVRKEIFEHGYMHAVVVTDVFEMKVLPDLEEEVNFFRRLGLSLDLLVQAGLGEVHEKVMVWVQTISGFLTLEMPYERTSAGIKLGEVADGRTLSSGRFKFF